jgi:hypothetical protein
MILTNLINMILTAEKLPRRFSNKDDSWWIAGKGFAMIKLDVDPYASSLPLKILLGKPSIIW